jgi:transposase InsO family protein
MTLADWRLDVLLDPQRTGRTVTEVCAQHEISRDTFYRWRRRFDAVGMIGLLEMSRAPTAQPQRIPVELEALICRMRDDHPRWGARTIRTRLRRAGINPPAISTIHRVLTRNGKVVSQPKKRPKASYRRFERDAPNDLWQMDATRIDLNDGTETWVVDALDDHARFMLGGVATTGEPDGSDTWATFERAARSHGLPREVFTDNHLTFTGRLKGFEVDFEIRLKRLGVKHICGRPNYPQSRGKIERFHQTLKAWVADQGGADSVEHLQQLVDSFRTDYNEDRPHQGIDDLTPRERYRPSLVLYRGEVISDPTYPQGAVVRRADKQGAINFDGMKIALGPHWARRLMSVEPDQNRVVIRHGEEIVRQLIPDRTRLWQPLPRRPRAI